MKHTDYLDTDIWFAWFPVKTDSGWKWLEMVERTIDWRPVIYQGLLEIKTYKSIH
jgi:hypothetical protein